MATPDEHGTLEAADSAYGDGHPGGEERLAALLASVPDALITVDERGAIESLNGAAERMFDYPASELLGRSFPALFADPHREEYRDVVRAFASGEKLEVLGLVREVTGRRSDGSSIPLELSLTEMRTGGKTLLLAVARNVAERKRRDARLREFADHDPLTGLLNRRGFEEALTKHIDYAARYGGAGSLLVLDIDNLKNVNDTLGQRVGDELIKGVAGLIRARLRKTDLLSRLEGNEFAVLLHGAEGEPANKVAHELREIVAKRDFLLESRPLKVTVSVGMAPLGEERLSGAEFLAHADMAMHAAKDQGGDRVIEFTREGQAEIAARHALSERVRQATEQGLFVLQCQPILDLRTDQSSQYELLLRMRGELGNLVEPASFLSTAERFGLIQNIDRWVAEQAIHLVASHDQAGQELQLQVNLSAVSMNDPDFVTMIGRELTATGVEPSRLAFEVTETSAVADLDRAHRFAEDLTHVGCRFALDNFGVGFSSFYHLKQLPISYLKIEGELIESLTRTPTDQVLVKAIVQVAQGLGIKTIAEFVSDDETVEMLRAFGVDYAQGYHIGRPRPVEELRG